MSSYTKIIDTIYLKFVGLPKLGDYVDVYRCKCTAAFSAFTLTSRSLSVVFW